MYFFRTIFFFSHSIGGILLWTVFLAACSDSSNNDNPARGGLRPPTVEAVQVITGNLPLEETLTGVVRAHNQTGIYPEISAPVTQVLAHNGDFVEQGQILLRLRDTEARERLRQAESGHEISRARVRQAEADLNRNQLSLQRVRQLRSRDLETEAELENITAQVESALASLDLAKAQLNQAESIVEERRNDLQHTVVRAPITGMLGMRNAEVGQQVNSATRLFQIGDPDRMVVEVTLTEAMTSYIRAGHPAVITSRSASRPVEGTITRISPFLHPVSHTTTAEIEVDNPDMTLRPGMFVTINIRYGESEHAVLVPNNAMFYHPEYGTQGVYVADRTGQELQFEGGVQARDITAPSPVQFVPVRIVARGRSVSGIHGISHDSWVVTLGQNLLLRGNEQANVRPVDWEHILGLQELHTRDIFEIIQQKMVEQSPASKPDV